MGLLSGLLQSTLHRELASELNPSNTQEEREYHRQQALEAKQALHVDRTERHRQDLLAQPGSIDTVVARGLSELMPSVKKVNYSKYPGKAEALDETTPDDSPMRGFATRTRTNLMGKLAQPGALLRDNPNELMIKAVQEEFARPPKEGDSESTIEQAYKYKRNRDSQLFQWGEDKSIRKPHGEVAGFPSYDDWITKTRAQEDKQIQEEGWVPSWKELLTTGAAFGATEAALTAWTGPGAVAAGALGFVQGVAVEAISHPIRRAIHGTDWYKTLGDTGKLATNIGFDLLSMWPANKMLKGTAQKALASLIEDDAVKAEFLANPSAKNFSKLGSVFGRAKAAEEVLKPFKDMGDSEIYDLLVERGLKGGERGLERGTWTAAERTKYGEDILELEVGGKKWTQGKGWETPETTWEEKEFEARANAANAKAGKEFKSAFSQLRDEAKENVLEKALNGMAIPEAVSKTLEAERNIQAIDRVNQEVYAKSQAAERANIGKKFSIARDRENDLFERRQTVFREANARDLKAKSLAAKVRDRNAIRLGSYADEYITQGVKDLPPSELGPEYEEWLDSRQMPTEETPGTSGGKLLRSLMLPIIAAGSVGVASLWPTDEAHAGVASELVGEVSAGIGKLTVAAAKKVGLTAEDTVRLMDDMGVLHHPVPKGSVELPREQEVAFVGKQIKEKYGSTANTTIIRTTALPGGVNKALSPVTVSSMALHPAEKISIDIAQAQNVIRNNVKNYLEVVSNSLKANNIPDQSNEVIEYMRPVVERYTTDSKAFNAIDKQVKSFEQIRVGLVRYGNKKGLELDVPGKWGKRIPVEYKTVDTAVGYLNNEIEKLATSRETLKTSLDEQDIAVEEMYKKYAVDHSSARVFLAANDTLDFKNRPWLKGMMTYDDTVAAAKQKEIYNRIGVRAEAAGLQIRHEEFPFVHNALHPDVREEMGLARLRELNLDSPVGALPYSEFPSRSPYSKALVPDAWYTMRSYIHDAETRIQMHQFNEVWKPFLDSDEVAASPLLSGLRDDVRKMMIPTPNTTGDQWVNRYTAFETLRLLGGMPSVGFKHIFKAIGTVAQFGVERTFKVIPKAVRLILANSADRGWLAKFGWKGPDVDRTLLRGMQTFVNTGRMSNQLNDLGFTQLADRAGWMGQFDRLLAKVNEGASFFVAGAEALDRTVTFLAAMDMANKQGMTAFQAMYGIYDSIMTNNFLGGNLNPAWLRDPKIRALTLFQGTSFKVTERRFMDLYGTGRTIKTAIGNFKGKDIANILSEMKGLKRFILDAQDELKGNIISDALNKESDFFGTPAAVKFMREALITGTIIYGGAKMGLNLLPQTMHMPFVETAFTHRPQIAQPPILAAIWDTAAARRKAQQEDEEPNFFATDFLQHWMGGKAPLPSIVRKAARISEQDIPEIYKDSPMRYLFSVPASGE